MYISILTLTLLLAVPPSFQSSPPPAQPTLSSAQISLIKQRLSESAHASWELGTQSLALISLDIPLFSPFNFDQSLPPPSSPPSSTLSSLSPIFDIANKTLAQRPTTPLPNPPLFADTSAADPACVGTAVLIANWTGQGEPGAYAKAAEDELTFLFSGNVPKTSDGAFSHRREQLQLWSDYVYMVPPFLAYYGALNANQSLLMEAYNQIRLYRSYLHDPSTNLWRHIVLGSGTDPGFWATGNGWAALGILRVLAIIQRSSFANSMKHQQGDLANWVGEIHKGAYARLNTSTHLFTNYIDNSSTFPDASSTALLAASVYRVSTLWGDHRRVKDAEGSRMVLVNSTSSNPSNSNSNSTTTPHINPQGWLTPVVNPYSISSEGKESPEGQAFVLEMEAAWRDWVDDGSRGSGAGRVGGGLGGLGWMWVGVLVVGMGMGWEFWL